MTDRRPTNAATPPFPIAEFAPFDAVATLRAIADVVIAVDTHGRVVFLNPAAERMLGCSASIAAGRPLGELCLVLDASTRIAALDAVRFALERGRQAPASPCLLVRRDGAEVAIEESAAAIVDAEGHPCGAVLVLRDVGPTMQAALADAHRALHDPLTGLANRRLLRERLLAHCAAGPVDRGRLAVAFLDLDGLKAVNDVLGHDAGDHVLCETASRLLAAVGRDDLVCRHGGDEFVVLLAHVTSAAQARRRARRLLDRLAPPHALAAGAVRVSASLGLAVWPDDGATPDALLTTADVAMYRAKRRLSPRLDAAAASSRRGSVAPDESPRAHTLHLTSVRKGGPLM